MMMSKLRTAVQRRASFVNEQVAISVSYISVAVSKHLDQKQLKEVSVLSYGPEGQMSIIAWNHGNRRRKKSHLSST